VHGGEETGKGNTVHEALGVEGRQSERALAHVQQALRKPDHEEVVGLLVVVGRQTPQQLGRTRVVGAGGDQVWTLYGSQRQLGVRVV
jgi:hypothetical protein